MVNDKPDETWKENRKFHEAIGTIVLQMAKDTIQRNA